MVKVTVAGANEVTAVVVNMAAEAEEEVDDIASVDGSAAPKNPKTSATMTITFSVLALIVVLMLAYYFLYGRKRM